MEAVSLRARDVSRGGAVVAGLTAGAGVSERRAAHVDAAVAANRVCADVATGGVWPEVVAGICGESVVRGFCTEAQPVLPSIAEMAPQKQYNPTLTPMTAPKE